MEYLLKASAVITLFYLCYKLFLQRETFFESNRWFLLTGLIATFLIPLIVIPIYITVAADPIHTASVFGNGIAVTPSTVISTFDFWQLLPIIYISGVVFFIIRFGLQFGSLFILLLNNNKQKSGPFTFIKTPNDVSPFSFFKWIVFNPKQFDKNELGQIITHEKAHARQYHSIDILTTQFASIIFWFNPLIWLYKKELQQNLEFIADQTAQEKSDCKKSYQHLLLKTSVPEYKLALSNNFYNSLIKKRIVMLHKNRSKNRNQWKFTLILPLVALFLMSFSTEKIISYSDLATPLASTSEFISDGDIEAIMITKDFTDAQFDELVKRFAKEGITLKFKNIKRNGDDEITAIKIDVSSEKANANFHTSSDEPIEPIKLVFDSERNRISIGESSDMHFGGVYGYKSKDGKYEIRSSGKGNNTFHFSSDDDDDHDGEYEVIEDDDKIIIKSGTKVHEIKKRHKDNNVFVYSDDDHDSDHDVEVIELKGDGDGTFVIKKGKNGNIVKERIYKGDKGGNVWISSGEGSSKVQTSIGKGDSKFIVYGSGKDHLFILDGKEVSQKVVDELDTDKIDSIEVLKGTSATKKYGKKAKDGVILITTKKD